MAERHAHRRCPVRERRVAQAGGRVEVRIDAVVRYVPKRGDRLAGSRRAGGVPQHQDPQTRRERPVMAASFDPAETTADVIIVGSGAAGGMAAYSLTRAGLRCLMLEAGRDYDPTAEVNKLATESDAPLRGAATPNRPFGYFDATVDVGWEDRKSPRLNSS